MTLQQEATNMINCLPDDSIQLIIEMMKRMVYPVTAIMDNISNTQNTPGRLGVGIGIMNDSDGFDEMNTDVLDCF